MRFMRSISIFSSVRRLACTSAATDSLMASVLASCLAAACALFILASTVSLARSDVCCCHAHETSSVA